MDGFILNVEKHVDFDNNKKIHIKVDNNGSYLSHDKMGLTFGDNKHEWKLNLIENGNDVNNLLGTQGVVVDTGIPYPFYMITSGEEKYALKCINGKISLAETGNYNSQKWDVSSQKIMENQLVHRSIYETPIGPLKPSSVETDKDRIKVNLNINDDKLKEILNIDNNQFSEESSSKCDTYLPKAAIESLCPGCEY